MLFNKKQTKRKKREPHNTLRVIKVSNLKSVNKNEIKCVRTKQYCIWESIKKKERERDI